LREHHLAQPGRSRVRRRSSSWPGPRPEGLAARVARLVAVSGGAGALSWTSLRHLCRAGSLSGGPADPLPPASGAVPPQGDGGSGAWVLRLMTAALRRAKGRCRARQHGERGRNRRAAIEATVRRGKHPFAGGKAPVWGRFRVACTVIGATAVVNVRRLHRFWRASVRPPQVERGQKGGQKRPPEPVERHCHLTHVEVADEGFGDRP
jgi:hypothetical protein